MALHYMFRSMSKTQFNLHSLDFEGNVNRIRHSVPQRDSFFTIDVEKVDEWYAALKIFIDLLYEEAVYFKMDTGIFTFVSRNEKIICCKINVLSLCFR